MSESAPHEMRYEVLALPDGYAVIDRRDGNRQVFATRHRNEAATRCGNLNSQEAEQEAERPGGTAAAIRRASPKEGRVRTSRGDESRETDI